MSKFETSTQESRREKGGKKKKTSIYNRNVTPKREKKWLTTQDTVFESGTSSRMNGPSLPALNKVRSYFDTIKQASEDIWGILNAFCSASNYCSIRLSKSLSSSTLPVISNRVKYKAHWTFVTRSWKEKCKEL